MADIELRFDKDMLVVSAPMDAVLARQGIDVRDLGYFMLMEPDTMRDALRIELLAGAQCLTAMTRTLTPARLAHERMDDRLADLAQAALATARELTPQHILVELGFCGLPFDASSEFSRAEHRDQYARAARAFEAVGGFDAYLLSGFDHAGALACAVEGLISETGRPVMALARVDAEGACLLGGASVEEACAAAATAGASVAGFSSDCGVAAACDLARRAASATDVPLMVQLDVPADAREQLSLFADELARGAEGLRRAGAQFLRAGAGATPACTGALVAVTTGLDVVRPSKEA